MINNPPLVSRKTLLRWCGWFFLGNIFLFWLIGLHYLPAAYPRKIPYEFSMLSTYGKSLRTLFVTLSFWGHLGLIAFAPSLLVATCIFLLPNKKFIFSIAILIASIAACLFVFDTVAFNLYRFHLNGIMLALIANGLYEQILGFSSLEYLTIGVVIIGIFTIEMVFAYVLWMLVQKKKLLGLGKWFGAWIGLSCYLSYSMIFFSSDQIYMHKVFIDSARFLPFYYDVVGNMLVKNGLTMVQRSYEGFMVQPPQVEANLNYPKANFIFTAKKQPFNLLIIMIDAWRFDMVNEALTPNIFRFAQSAQIFQKHFSGGNSTGPGMFSLFYSLPGTYWTSMENQQRSPVIIDELIKNHYRTGIFSSATLRLPAFNRTVFQAIKNLKYEMPGETIYGKDLAVTDEFKKFINTANTSTQPFFSFLFYDGVHSYCHYKEDLKPLKPAVLRCERDKLTAYDDPAPYFNRYKNALILVDKQVGQVLDTLKKNHLLDNTVVILTADHGEEFNDNLLGYWGHAGNYTHYQMQTPLIIHWPGEKAQQFFHETSHYDIVPTLMVKLFNNPSPIEAYSFGKNLYDVKTKLPYFLVASYIGFGVIEQNRITSVYPQGNFEIQQLNAEPIFDAKLNFATMKNVFHDMQRFYRNKTQA